MTPESIRKLAPLTTPFVSSATADTIKIDNVEGGKLGTPVTLKTLMVSPSMVFVETSFSKGQASPPHSHDDHESIVYIVSGKVKATIDGKAFVAGPGDAWYNAPGVVHNVEALEDSVSVEVKSPPTKAW
ncbi:MAG: cupin domain-containing protein [Alphaproteobacteria bacterium]|nr:cupin domain-containing protein [Alphaproteobacteria bacterium]